MPYYNSIFERPAFFQFKDETKYTHDHHLMHG